MKEFIIPNEIKTVLDMLYQSGFSAYIVGGCVRDILMDKIPHDYDVTTSAIPEQTLEVFRDFQTYELGRKFGTITVVSGGYHVEITTMRTEKGYADGRRPDEVIFTDSIMEDASRRDFTINAMAYSLKDGFFDGFDGITDLDNKLIRAVGDAERRFTEDGLRIMRALRFAARFGFEIEEKTSQAMEKCTFMLDNIARERIREELDGFLISKGAVGILDRYFDIFCRIIPQLETADKSALLGMIADAPADNLSRLTALLWQTDEVRDILRNLRHSNEVVSSVAKIVENKDARLENDADIRRLMSKIGYENTRILVGLIHKDKADNLERVKNHPHRISDLAVSGEDLKEMGISGKKIGETLGWLLEAVLENPLLNEKDKLIGNVKSRLA